MTRTASEIQDWIVARVAALTGQPPADVDPGTPLARHGLDSVAVITLVADLEKWLGYRFRENPLDRYPTISAIAAYVSGELARGSGGSPPA